MRALLSVSDKRGIVELARELVTLGWEIVSTGGTAETLRQAGVPVIPIDAVTGFPEMMEGRVKTLHPKVHGGLLARRRHPGDRAALQQHGITPIDLVAVNLYPFRETIAKPNVGFEQAIEQIDIGGPSMLRSAAKNPGASPGGAGSLELRRQLAAKVFAHTAAYDATIYNYLVKDQPGWPERITLALERRQELRYGENCWTWTPRSPRWRRGAGPIAWRAPSSSTPPHAASRWVGDPPRRTSGRSRRTARRRSGR